jgi:DivIVA domain-containing protein
VARNEPPHRTPERGETTPRIPPVGARLKDVRDPLPEGIRDPHFPPAIRGYDRHAVDMFVEQVNGLIAELQVSGSPRAAVRHALDRVGEQTSGILQHARETAEEITKSALEEAEDTTARAKAEAQDITTGAHAQALADAEERTRQVEQEIASLREGATRIADERRAMLDDVRRIAARLQAIVAEAEPAEEVTPPPERPAPNGAET